MSRNKRYTKLGPMALGLVFLLVVTGIGLAVCQIFSIAPFGFIQLGSSFLYSIIALFVAPAFLIFPFRRGAGGARVTWYDFLLFALTFGSAIYLSMHGEEIALEAWRFTAPPVAVALSVLLWLLILEGARRTMGWAVVALSLLFSVYPLFAEYMPWAFQGISYTFLDTAKFHVLSTISMLGVPLQVFATLLVGFLIFGVVIQLTGGGEFFINLASALVGSARGGVAKVSVISSAFFGSMSGSGVANVVTTGSFTIPAMIRMGYRRHYAAAVECCASTGGVVMPPVMGAVAFIMADILGVNYATIALAAMIPAIVYYSVLIVETDLYAAREGLLGFPKEEIPRVWQTLKEGWIYILAFLVLLWVLFFWRLTAQAPFYASGILIVLAQIRRKTRFTPRSFVGLIVAIETLFAEIGPAMCAVGLILGGLLVTGVAQSLPTQILMFAGESLLPMLIMGACVAFILGMGVSITAVYIILAVLLAPALVDAGFYPIAVHLFLIYYSMLSYITPPVAVAAFVAGPIAGAPSMKVGFTACRLGLSFFFLPFFFIFNPALMLHGSIGAILLSSITCLVGFFFVAASLEGYIYFFGRLPWLPRIAYFIAGGLLAMPGVTSDVIGLLIATLLFSLRRQLGVRLH